MTSRWPAQVWCALLLLSADWGATSCGGRAYDPDVDGQSHWWRACEDDVECGAGLSCICGACTQGCEDRTQCSSTERRACVPPPAWCTSKVSAACTATCERSADCPLTSRCEAGVCIALPPLQSSSSATTEVSVLDAGCSNASCVDPGDAQAADAVASSCGDQVLDDRESCDDGNLSDGDGCSARCQIEQGYVCQVDPDECKPVCGDGLLRPGEACDDGNVVSGDGCSGSCNLEPN